MAELLELLRDRNFAALKERVNSAGASELSKAWPRLKPLEKATFFKLLEPPAAMEFYRALSFEEKYFILGAFEPGCIAPVVADLPPAARSLFRRLSEDCFDQMVRQLA